MTDSTRSGDLPESLRLVVDAVEDHKGTDLLILDLRGIASFADYMVLCSAGSDRHAQAVVDGIRDRLRDVDVRPLHTEGYEQASWVLVDFVEFLVNVFTPETRDFYQLERVWRDAPVLVGERRVTSYSAASADVVSEDDPEPAAGSPGSPQAAEAVDG